MVELLRTPDILNALKIKTTKLHFLVKEGKFPAPTKLGGNGINVWRSDVVENWIKAQTKEAA